MNPNGATNDATRDTTEGILSREGVALCVAAKALGVSLQTVQRCLDKGELRFIKRDGKRFVLLEGENLERDTTSATRSEREKERREEIGFLRGLVENHARAEAELRAALGRH